MVNSSVSSKPGSPEMENLSEDEKRLVHRLNRIQGQVEAVKKSLVCGEEKPCLETMQLIKAANQAMKKFGEAYLHYHVHKCMRNKSSNENIGEELKTIIHSIFTM